MDYFKFKSEIESNLSVFSKRIDSKLFIKNTDSDENSIS